MRKLWRRLTRRVAHAHHTWQPGWFDFPGGPPTRLRRCTGCRRVEWAGSDGWHEFTEDRRMPALTLARWCDHAPPA